MKRLIADYRKIINPPYSKKDFPIIAGTLLFLLFAALLVINLPNRFKTEQTKQSGAQGTNQTVQQSVPDEILLRFKPGAKKNVQDRILAEQGLTIKEEIPQIEVKVLKVAPEARDKVTEALSRNPAVDFAEKNGFLSAELVPNDPWYPNWQKYLQPKYEDAEGGWDITTGSSSVTVGVIDTGVDGTLPDFGGKVSGDPPSIQNCIHGTAVAGTVAAVGNNGRSVAGIDWKVKIRSYNVFPTCSSATFSAVASAVTQAADFGVKVVNMSLGADVSCPSTLQNAISYAWNKGVVSVAAAGNSGTAVGTPANCKNVISAGGWTQNTSDGPIIRNPGSSYGQDLDLLASMFVQSIYPDSNGNEITSAFSGTSYASPQVVGAASLIFAVNPSFTPQQVVDLILKNTTDLGSAGWDQETGWGMVNYKKALTAASGGAPSPDTTSPTVSVISPANGSTVSGSITVSASASDNVGVTKVELYVDGSLFATDTSSPYSFFLDTTTLSNANHTLLAKAYDAAGNVGSSSSITITVSNTSPTPTSGPTNTPTPIPPTPTPGSTDTTSPSVSITFPLAGAIVRTRSTVTISATASDNVGVSRVEFYVNNTLTCPADTTAPYTCSWKVPGAKNKTYTLSARAYDAAGNSSTSSITVTAK